MIHVTSISYDQAKRLIDRVRLLIPDDELAKSIEANLKRIEVDLAVSLDHAYVGGMMDYKRQLKELKNGSKEKGKGSLAD